MTDLTTSNDRRTYTALIVGTAVNALGSGVYLPLSLLILSGMTGLTVAAVGAILTVAQLFAVTMMPLVGRILDQVSAKHVLITAMVAQAAGFALYPLLPNTATFAAVSGVIAVGNQTGKTARPMVIALLSHDRARDRLLALNRSLANAGLGMGGLVLAVSSATDSRAYAPICWFNAATFLTAALLTGLLRISSSSPPAPSRVRLRGMMADAAYARFLGATFCASLLYSALTMLIPIYIVNTLHQSMSVAGILFVINTAIAALGGVPAITLMHRLRMTRVQCVNAGMLLMAAGLAVLPLGDQLGSWGTAFVVMAVVVYSSGEVIHSPASSALSLSAGPKTQRGRYQAHYQMTMTLGAAAAPATFTFLLSRWPSSGAAFAALCGVVGIGLMARTPDAS